ncbi:MAG: glycosyltransferase family 2 protein [Rhodobacteraceae bacterium]|nr:glycosyltransferase family 2 protein [Paracoccaceae bacterium]
MRPRLTPPFAGNGRKVVLSTMKNEGPYLLEWIAHYLNQGFDDFVLFSNDCSDGTNLLLNRLDAMGIVHHFDNPIGHRMDPQRRAYSRANQMDVVRDASWVLIADADEFLNVHAGDGSVDALIGACPPETEAISINWRLFGSGGQRHMLPEPVTQRFTRACNVEEPENGLIWGFKTLFRPASFDYFGVHRPRFEKKREIHPDQVHWVNGRGELMGERYMRSGWRSSKNIVAYDFAQMNHYAIKSREEFLLKRLRGTANSKDKDRIDLGYWDKFDLNACEDATIQSGDLQGRMEELLQDDDLASLHRAALDTALRAIEMQLEDPELRDFVEGDGTSGVAAQ